jgi:hypothetical protein
LPGTYRIEASAQGFKQHTRRPIEVQVGAVITIDVALEIGQMSEKVDVVANAAPANTLFGQVTAMQGEARRIYAGLKLMF